MNFETILRAVTMVGANLPAFKLIFDEAKNLFDEADQAVLQQAYEDAIADSDDLHNEAQNF